MTRRNNGEGTIYFSESKKLWVGQIAQTDYLGNIRRKTFYGKTKKEVLSKVKAASIENAMGIVDANNITVGQILSEFLMQEEALNRISASTMVRKKEIAKIIFSHSISDIPINKVSENDIIKFLSSLVNYSDSVIKKEYQLLKKVFGIARYKKLIYEDFFCSESVVKQPKSMKETKNVTAFTLEEEKAFLKALELESKIVNEFPNDYTVQFLIELFAGLRMGEINALYVEDIDFENNKIYVRRTMTSDKNDRSIVGKTAKTKAGIRQVTMVGFLRDILAWYITYQYPKLKKSKKYPNLLFINQSEGSTGTITTCQVNERFKRICDKYGIRPGKSVNQHMLRHTFATRSIESGMAYDVLQKMIGHKSIKTTIDTYCDVFEANEQKNMKIMNTYLQENSLTYSTELAV